MQELVQMEGFKILSPEIQKFIQEKWVYLSSWSKNMIIENLKLYQEYQDTAIEILIKDDEDFSKKLQNFIIKKRKEELSKIEKEEEDQEQQYFKNLFS